MFNKEQDIMAEKIDNKLLSQHTIIKAGAEDIPVLREVLSKAFDNDLFSNWVVKQDNKRQQRFAAMFDCSLRFFGLAHGHLYTNQDRTGAALWVPPGKYNPESLTNLKLLPAWLKVVGLGRFIKVMQGTNVLGKH